MANPTPTKICSTCQDQFPATPEFFYRSSKAHDGLKTICKHCHNKASAKYFQKNKDRRQEQIRTWNNVNAEAKKEYARRYYQENKERILALCHKYQRENLEKVRERGRKYNKNHQQEMKEAFRKWQEKNKEFFLIRRRAREAVRHALHTGKITRPALCSLCNQEKKVQAHHHKGYELPHRLDIQWLCKDCHAKSHTRYSSPATAPSNPTNGIGGIS